jgi:hypothetical protein
MDTKSLAAAERRLRGFLQELVTRMGRAGRQHWVGLYIRGLLLDGERKSIEPTPAPVTST